jgi:hypothetical protein
MADFYRKRVKELTKSQIELVRLILEAEQIRIASIIKSAQDKALRYREYEITNILEVLK